MPVDGGREKQHSIQCLECARHPVASSRTDDHYRASDDVQTSAWRRGQETLIEHPFRGQKHLACLGTLSRLRQAIAKRVRAHVPSARAIPIEAGDLKRIGICAEYPALFSGRKLNGSDGTTC